MTAFNRAGHAFLKTAAPRWQKLLRAGEMAEPDARRLMGLAAQTAPVSSHLSNLGGGAAASSNPYADALSKAVAPKVSPVAEFRAAEQGRTLPTAALAGTASNEYVAKARALMQAVPALKGKQLDRLRQLRTKQLTEQSRHFGKHPALYVDSWGPLAAAHPHSSPVGSKIRVSSGELAGKRMKNALENQGDPTGGFSAGIQDWLSARTLYGRIRPVELSKADSALALPVFRHELGEASELSRQFRERAGNPVPAMYGGGAPAAVHGGHFGLRPLLEENLHARMDPHAMETFAKARALNGADQLAQQELRRAGNVGGHVVQPGTRQARSAERVLHGKLQRNQAEAEKRVVDTYTSLGMEVPKRPQQPDVMDSMMARMSPKVPFNF